MGDPRRFRVEVLFSPGAAFNPLTHTPADHALPVVPLVQLNEGAIRAFLLASLLGKVMLLQTGSRCSLACSAVAAGTAETLAEMQQLLEPFSAARKVRCSHMCVLCLHML